MSTQNETPEVQTPTRLDRLLAVRAVVIRAVWEAESILGITDAFPVTVNLAKACDELNAMVQREARP